MRRFFIPYRKPKFLVLCQGKIGGGESRFVNRFAQILSKQRSAANLTFVVTRDFTQAASENNISLEDLQNAAADFGA